MPISRPFELNRSEYRPTVLRIFLSKFVERFSNSTADFDKLFPNPCGIICSQPTQTADRYKQERTKKQWKLQLQEKWTNSDASSSPWTTENTTASPPRMTLTSSLPRTESCSKSTNPKIPLKKNKEGNLWKTSSTNTIMPRKRK